jgi:ABC-2 type transport system permease protein
MRYSQFKAMWAITKGSLRAITRSPSAMIFSFIFPFIFILVFGFIGGGGAKQTFKVVIDERSDTANEIYKVLQSVEALKIKKMQNDTELQAALLEGKVAGVIFIEKISDNSVTPFRIALKSTSANNDKWPQLKNVLDNVVNNISNEKYPNRPAYVQFDFDPAKDVNQVRVYKTIDFILPGQLGFSLLSAGVFGVAFMFFNLRNTLVLKRFFATPINKTFIILGEGLSRVIFQLITAVVIILVGYFCFGFTLVHHAQTFVDMMILSFIGLVVFMGFGFIVSGVATSDSTIPPFANLITLPQFLLGGTFFSVDSFPKWLQPISKALPLTHLNSALRSVAFEGQSLWQVKSEIGILLVWGILAYAVAVKVFKWE